jgi:hypothetical protein
LTTTALVSKAGYYAKPIPEPKPPRTSCGSCTLCCKLIGVAELDPPKPMSRWCQHCEKGSEQGCRIYETRPGACSEFLCLWRQIGDVPDELRPDKVKAVMQFTGQGNGISVHVDPGTPAAWRQGKLAEFIQRAYENGVPVVIVIGPTRRILLAKGRYDGVALSDETGTQSFERMTPERIAR